MQISLADLERIFKDILSRTPGGNCVGNCRPRK